MRRFIVCFLVTAAVLSMPTSCGTEDKKNAQAIGPVAEVTKNAEHPLLELLSPEATGITFANQILETEQNNVLKNINFYNGGGVCVADFDLDGLQDVYFICCNGKNILYKNEGNFHFRDVTDEAGVASVEGFESAAGVADINADGLPDIYLCRSGSVRTPEREIKIYINDPARPGHFSEQGANYGLNDKSPATGMCFFDYDNDGDLDCYILNYPENQALSNELLLKMDNFGKVTADLEPKQEFDSDRLYRNDGRQPDGAWHFTEVSKSAGIHNLGFGLSVSSADINRDGYMDLYVANDFLQPDNLYINNRKGGFTDQLKTAFRHNSVFSMGVDINDFDNDGLLDIFSLDMLPSDNYRQKASKTTNPLSRYLSIVQSGIIPPVTRNTLQRNNGDGTFSDLACLSGIYKTDWAWSCLMADFDNDGFRDIYITNGYRKDVNDRDFHDFIIPEFTKTKKLGEMNMSELQDFLSKVPVYKSFNFVYQNKGNWQFEDQSGKWATIPPTWSCGSAWADLDNDGDLDLLVNNLEEPAMVYKNLSREQNKGHYLQAKLQGSTNNPLAVGASVLIEYNGGQQQFQELSPNKGIFSSSEHLIHFGVGNAQVIDKLSVRWPDGKTQVLTQVPTNQRLTLRYADASGSPVPSLIPAVAANPLFQETNAGNQVAYRHKENNFVDFETWPLLPWTISDLGPLMAVGDINNDGLEDVFVGNAFDSPAALLQQNADGSFKAVSQAVFDTYKNYEDNGAVFFDADKDGDQDLLVSSGGPEASSDQAWQIRLFINDGKGKFSNETVERLPVLKDLCMRMSVQDYDNDGDLDIFAGGRIVPQKWPLTPRSVVLRNNNGKFEDVTEQIGGDFARCGMVTDMLWQDLNGDQKPELVVAGEWMPVSVFAWTDGKLRNMTANYGLDKTNGLWNRLVAADLDGDGDQDLVAGNLGLNTRFTASETAPFHVFAADFDKNATLDPMVAQEDKGRMVPLMQKEVVLKQMPILKKKFLYSRDYAAATLQDLFAAKDLETAQHLLCYELQSCWFENKQGQLIKHVLPVAAQVSTVQGMIARDFDQDGALDLLLAGNKYGFEVETNQADASVGVFLKGDGKGGFQRVDNRKTGFWAPWEARDMALLRGSGGKNLVVVSNNNRALQVFKVLK
jgi:enediyne biosynthesis protein E4